MKNKNLYYKIINEISGVVYKKLNEATSETSNNFNLNEVDYSFSTGDAVSKQQMIQIPDNVKIAANTTFTNNEISKMISIFKHMDLSFAKKGCQIPGITLSDKYGKLVLDGRQLTAVFVLFKYIEDDGSAIFKWRRHVKNTFSVTPSTLFSKNGIWEGFPTIESAATRLITYLQEYGYTSYDDFGLIQ